MCKKLKEHTLLCHIFKPEDLVHHSEIMEENEAKEISKIEKYDLFIEGMPSRGFPKVECIWVPRIQEIIILIKDEGLTDRLLKNYYQQFIQWPYLSNLRPNDIFKSREELWMAICMNYRKGYIWDKDNWKIHE